MHPCHTRARSCQVAEEGVNVTFVLHNSANYTLPWPVDMLFIDTW